MSRKPDIEVTIEITQYCDRHCPFCSTDATVHGRHLPIRTIKEFLQKTAERYHIARLNLSGGEPLAHPAFYKILKFCETIVPFGYIYVYTNALNNIIFNTEVMNGINIEANVPLCYGQPIIPKNVSQIHLLKLVEQGRCTKDMIPPITVSSNLASEHECSKCNNILLQADGTVVQAPCKKTYGRRKD